MLKIIDKIDEYLNLIISKLIKPILGPVCFYILPLTLLTLIFILNEQNLYELSRNLAESALNLLVFILFIKPFARILPRISSLNKVVMLRKELGVAMFYFAFFHMVGMFMTTSLLSSISSWFSDITNPIFFGGVATVLLLPLYFTSNIASVKLLKRNWKRLHYLAYPALLFALMHKFGVGHEHSVIPAFELFGLFVVLKIAEFSGLKILKKELI